MTQRALARIAAAIGDRHVLRSPEAMEPFLREWRGVVQGQAAAVIRPGTTAEIAAVLTICAEALVAVTPQGGNTGLCAGAVPQSPDAILLSLSRLSRLRSVDAQGFCLTAEAGCVLATVQAAADRHDRLFPLSLGSEGSAQIGGLVATNAGGVHVLRYGTMRDLVLGLEVVLADGRVWNGLSALRKDNTGYDLKQLFIGAEGTLGVVTAATLKLFPRPGARRTCLFGMADAAALIAVFAHVRSSLGDRLLAAEMIADACVALALANVAGARLPLAQRHAWYLLIEWTVGPEGPDASETMLAVAIERGLAADAVIAETGAQAQAMWFLREAIVEGERLEHGSLKHDISLPISSVPPFLASATRRLEQALPGVRVAPFGHVGDGNIHFNLVRPASLSKAAFLARAAELSEAVYDEVGQFGGSISAEHGIGLTKRAALAAHKPALDLELMRRIKAALDPANLMNPGKLL